MATNIKRIPTNMNDNENKILYKDLSYKLQGLFFDIRNDLGSGHKESIYQKALEKELNSTGIKFTKEPAIKIYSRNGDYLGLYRPDFLIEDKIVVELKAVAYVSKQESARVYDYLRNSKYELAYLINFASPRLYIKRLIFTNDKKSRLKNLVMLFVAISFLFVGIRGVQAAQMFFDAKATQAQIGEKFEVKLFVDSKQESVNAFEAKMVFPKENLNLKEIRDGNTIVNFWLEKPKNQNGAIVFSGVTPGGFNGEKGLIFSAIFEAKKEGVAKFEVNDARVLRNDGIGSAATLTIAPLEVAVSKGVLAEVPVSPKVKDRERPESFMPEIAKDETLFNGKWFVVFATQDKASGIDRYEIKESRQKILSIFKKWTFAESPYVLADQKLRSHVLIKAVDKAGNERIIKINPQNPLAWYENYENWIMIIIGVLVAMFIAKKLWRKRRT